MEQTLYTRSGIFRELQRQGRPIAQADVYRILTGVDPDGLVKSNAGFTLETFDEAYEADKERLLGGGKIDDAQLTELIKKHKREQITKLQLDNDNKRKLLIDRKEVLDYLCEHQTRVCGLLKFYLLNKIPSDIKDPAARQRCLELYNEIISAIQKSILRWVEQTGDTYEVNEGNSKRSTSLLQSNR
jgi:hypothetical protein